MKKFLLAFLPLAALLVAIGAPFMVNADASAVNCAAQYGSGWNYYTASQLGVGFQSGCYSFTLPSGTTPSSLVPTTCTSGGTIIDCKTGKPLVTSSPATVPASTVSSSASAGNPTCGAQSNGTTVECDANGKPIDTITSTCGTTQPDGSIVECDANGNPIDSISPVNTNSGPPSQSASGPADCSGASSAGGGIGAQLIGSAINRLCGGGPSCAALQMGLHGNIGAATATLCGGGAACSLIGGILNQSSIGHAININVNGIMNSATGGVNQIFNSLSNSITSGISSLGNSITSALGFGSPALTTQTMGSIEQNIAGSVPNVLTSNLDSLIGKNAAGSLANSLLSGTGLGSIAGLAAGAAAVPVSDSTLQGKVDTSNSHLNTIEQYQATQTQVVCVLNPMVRAASHQFAAQFSSSVLNALTTGNGGGPYYQASYPGEQNFVLDSAANYWVSIMGNLGGNQRFIPGAQQNFVNQYTYNNDLSQQLRCDATSDIDTDACSNNYNLCGSTAQERWSNYFIVNSEPGCTQAGTNQVLAGAGFNFMSSRASEQALLNQQAGGYTPKITCIQPAGYTGPSGGCQVFQIVTPSGGVQNIANSGANIGAQQQANASEIGQLVDSLLANLASQALTSLNGLSGLSQNSNGNSSYLSQLANNTNAATVATQATALKGTIESAMGTEASYESILSGNITKLTNVQTAEQSVQSCYLGLAT